MIDRMIDRMIIATTIADKLATSKANYEKTYYRYFAVFPSRGSHAEFLRVGQGSHRIDNDHTSDNGDAASSHADDDPNDTLLSSNGDSFQKGARAKRAPFYFGSTGARWPSKLFRTARAQADGHTSKVLRAAKKILAGQSPEGDPLLCL